MTAPAPDVPSAKKPQKRKALRNRKDPRKDPDKPLSQRELVFVEKYLIHFNGKQAALEAGYAKSDPGSRAHQLLKRAHIQKAIQERNAKRLEKFSIEGDRVLEEVAAIAFADMGNYLRFDPDGGIQIDLTNLPKGATRAILEVTQEVVWRGTGEFAEPVRITKFKLAPKTPALDLLMRHLGLLVNKHEVSGPNGGPIPVDHEHAVRFYLPDNGRDRQKPADAAEAPKQLTSGTPV